MKKDLIPTFILILTCINLLGQTEVKCEEGIMKQHGEDMDAYYTQTNTCTYGNILIKDETMEDSDGCIRTCHTASYSLIETGLEVKLEDLFNNKSELLSKINSGLKNDFKNVASDNIDCFENLTYYSVSFGSIDLTITKNGFIFIAQTGVPGYCEGVAGEISITISLKEMDKYL
jgi:hypothetical protein